MSKERLTKRNAGLELYGVLAATLPPWLAFRHEWLLSVATLIVVIGLFRTKFFVRGLRRLFPDIEKRVWLINGIGFIAAFSSNIVDGIHVFLVIAWGVFAFVIVYPVAKDVNKLTS